MDNEYILELKDIHKQFPGVKALDGACLYLRKGSVLALMGGNGAGKSTLMNCLFGILEMDSGTIIYEGEEVQFNSPAQAIEAGISMVHQELQPLPNRMVSENLFMGRFPEKKLFGVLPVVDHKTMAEKSAAILKQVHLDIAPETLLGELSIGQMQLVEIAKAISTNCKVLILDEPTSALSTGETTILFSLIKELRDAGVGIIYISHKMEEIFEISDEVCVMRDGSYVGTYKTAELDNASLIEKMLGRPLDQIYPRLDNTIGDVILKVEGYTSIHPNSFRNCSFELRQGEILGVGGLVGAQRTELMEAVYGLRSHSAGKLYLKGKEIQIDTPSDAIAAGISLLTESRRKSGILPQQSITDNMAVSSYPKHLKWKVMIDHDQVDRLVQENIKEMEIKVASPDVAIQTLSGGNQQKVLFGRVLANEPDILILDEPTRGIDVGAKFDIYCIMASLVEQGKSIIMISSDMAELIGISNRIMVMSNGQIRGFVEKEDMTEKGILNLSFESENKEV